MSRTSLGMQVGFIMENILFSMSFESFVTISIIAIVILFIIKLFFEDSTFEYLKIIGSVILFVFTILISTTMYKDEQINKFDNQIIVMKLSKLPKSEQQQYIEQYKTNIKDIKAMNIDLIFSIANFIIIGLLIIVIRDTIPKLKRLNLKKHNKSQEEEQGYTCDNLSY